MFKLCSYWVLVFEKVGFWSSFLKPITNKEHHSYDILGAGMLWKPKEARILTTNFKEF
jgi:hypothetical protein